MSDYTELKRLAIAAQNDCGDYVALNDYGMAMPPAVCLALIAENERLAAILARQKCRRADDDECLILATQSIDELRKDAERYRWLKSNGTGSLGVPGGWFNDSDEWDEGIDAAMCNGEQS